MKEGMARPGIKECVVVLSSQAVIRLLFLSCVDRYGRGLLKISCGSDWHGFHGFFVFRHFCVRLLSLVRWAQWFDFFAFFSFARRQKTIVPIYTTILEVEIRPANVK